MSFYRKLKFFLLIISLFGCLLAQTQNQNKYQLARELYRNGNYEKSELLFQELINSDKNNWLYLSGLNDLFQIKKEFHKSVKLLKDKLAENPGDITALCKLGVVYYKKENFDSTYMCWDRAFEEAGSDPDKATTVSSYPIRYGLNDKAIEYLTIAVKKIPNPVVFYNQLGNLYLSMSAFEKAVEIYCYLMEKDQKYFPMAQSAVRRMFLGNKANPAVGDLIKRKYEKTGNQNFLELLKEFYSRAGKYEKLKEIGLKIFKLNKNVNQMYSLGNELHHNKKLESAREVFQIILDNLQENGMQTSIKIKLLDIKRDKIRTESENKTEKYKTLLKEFQEILTKLKYKSFEPELLYKIAELKEITTNSYSSYCPLAKKYPEYRYGALANIKLAELYTKNGKLDSAYTALTVAANSKQISIDLKNEINFLIAKNRFWYGNYKLVGSLLSGISRDFRNPKSNEAIDFLLLMSLSRQDTLSLSKFAKADYMKTIGNYSKAASTYKELAENDNLLALNFYSAIKLAEVKIAKQKYLEAVEILEKLIQKEKISPFYDKALYLQGKIYQYGLGELTKAVKIYSDVIKKYPDSIYLDECRNNIMLIKSK